MLETEDGHRGFGKLNGAKLDNTTWKYRSNLVYTSSVEAPIRTAPTTKRAPFTSLPFGARVLLEEDGDRWAKVTLVDGKTGWMFRADLERTPLKTFDQVLNLANTFLERPYILGGTSSTGFDCSGLIQTLFKQMGILLPRKSRQQYKASTPSKALEKGDLVFFGNKIVTHVGLYLGDDVFIHSGMKDEKPKVTKSSLKTTEYHFLKAGRIEPPKFKASKKADGEVTTVFFNHWGFHYYVLDRALQVPNLLADEIIDTFKELFELKFPIESIVVSQGSKNKRCTVSINPHLYEKKNCRGGGLKITGLSIRKDHHLQ